ERSASISAEENKALVRRYFETGYQEAHEGNLDVVHQYFADHFHDHTSPHPDHAGVHGVKEIISDLSQATRDLRVKIVHTAAQEDIVFVHWRAAATHVGQHQLYKHVRWVEPTGEEGTVSGVTLYRIEGGKFVEEWNYHTVLEHGMAGPSGGSS
ncbi:MAG TPA: ester cyclase, partial [Propionibacteriaceae bacterium]|nr:ester cyclase [Propionibacteriaceae bacterium]